MPPAELRCEACERAEKRMVPEYPPAQFHTPTVEAPTVQQLEAWMFDIEFCQATDGCDCDPDGHCEHHHPSWMLVLGLI